MTQCNTIMLGRMTSSVGALHARVQVHAVRRWFLVDRIDHEGCLKAVRILLRAEHVAVLSEVGGLGGRGQVEPGDVVERIVSLQLYQTLSI